MWNSRLVARSVSAVAVALSLAACSLEKQEAPPLSGPSELGLSLAVTVTPDIITQDGVSVATIQVLALDGSSQPVRNLGLRVETYVGSTPVDFGQLSTKVMSTGNDGRAVATYRAPAAPPATQDADTTVTVVVSPVGGNYAGTVTRQADLRLARPGVIQVPTDGPSPSFFVSPSAPKEMEDVWFDASASKGSIVSYAWNFGDGDSQTTGGPHVRHNYELAGTYSATLTVTDHLGRSASTTPRTITVASASDPTASFTTSPASPRAGVDLVTFNGSGSKAAAGRRIVEYAYDFGDGTPMYVGSNPITHHTYATAKTYTVVLRVMDDTGRYAVSTSTVSVSTP
jgi:hypothetical protein